MKYNDEWVYLNKFVEMKIDQRIPDTRWFLCEVIESDGYLVKIKYVTNEVDLEPLEGIPVLQSKYDSPVVMPGDWGLLIDIKQNISPLLEGVKNNPILNSSFFVFLPIVKKEDYADENFKNDGLHRVIRSPDRASYIKLGDDGLVVEVVAATTMKAESLSIETTADTAVKADNLNIEATTAANIKSGEIALNGESAVKLESAAITIKGQDPIDFGTSQSLGATLGEICDALSGFMTTPTSPGAPATADPGFIAKIAAAKAKLAQILK